MTPRPIAAYRTASDEYEALPFVLPTDVTPAAPAAAVPPGLVLSVAENFPIQQLEGRECVLCEQPIVPGQELRPIWMDSHFDLYAHEQCPKGGDADVRHG